MYRWKRRESLIADTLPKQQLEVRSCWLHISYLLQKWKKANPKEKICPFWKTISQVF